VARRYSRYAQSPRKRRAWAAGNRGNVEIRREVEVRLLDLVRERASESLRVLDVGCGGGYWLSQLVEAGIPADALHGVDLQQDRLRAAQAQLPGVHLSHADATALPFADGSFDLALMFTVLSSLGSREAVRAALADAWRVLAPGGTILVWEARRPNPFNPATLRPRRADYVSALGPDLGFATVTLFPPLARRLGRLAPALYPRLARLTPLTTHWLIEARRSL
jgi:ubiquinone/menaquinone biosynthesis C-methylase UbiE